MTKRKKIIGAAIIILVIALGGYGLWLTFGKTGTAVTATFADLAARQGSWQCALEYSTDDVSSSGTVYVMNGELRGDFSFNIHPLGKQVESHIIRKDGYLYAWSPGAALGSRTPVSASPTASQGANPDEAYPYRCREQSVDASLFELPAGMAFLGAE